MILCAGGLHGALERPLEPLGAALSVSTSAGVALFLVGQAGSRVALGIGSARPHLVTALLVLAAAWVGVVGPGAGLLVALSVLLIGLSTWLSRWSDAAETEPSDRSGAVKVHGEGLPAVGQDVEHAEGEVVGVVPVQGDAPAPVR